MRLVYTDIRNHLTALLAEEASRLTKAGKRVFYIAPNSLSFEKERMVLSHLQEQGSFDLMVTRFGQLSRYFTMNETAQDESVDDLGLVMLFYRALSQFGDNDLRVFGKMKSEIAFIQQLVELYQEMQLAQVTLEDLTRLQSPEKQADLQKIFAAFEEHRRAELIQSQSKVAQFTRVVATGKLDVELQDVAMVVDGFTRFSAEEADLVSALHARGVDLLIGTYASQKAFRHPYIEGNIYQAGVEFLNKLSAEYQLPAEYIGGAAPQDSLGRISRAIEAHYDFSPEHAALSAEDFHKIQIWSAPNQKIEVEQVATDIRNLLQDGVRYKDILVLLGDVDSYQLQLGKIFDQFEIPYYLGRAEEMSHHPLVHFVESLERVKRYHYRKEDVLNLFKSGLYGRYQEKNLDQFEQYVQFADINGKRAFNKPFTATANGRYKVKGLNRLREKMLAPLFAFLSLQPQSGHRLLQRFTQFLTEISLTDNMQDLAAPEDQLAAEKQEQVWLQFTHILQEFHQIFGQEIIRVEDFLAILHAGMASSTYRLVPATVDVVNVKSYDLIEPHSAKYVFALGLSQSNFPKIAKNTSLLTDEERKVINAELAGHAELNLVTEENIKKNHSTMISLVNAATEQLVLSAPQIFNEAADVQSPYMVLLGKMGFQTRELHSKQQLTADNIGSYKSLLSRVILANREGFEEEMTTDEATFWSVAQRLLRKQLDKSGISIPAISRHIDSKPLAPDTLKVLFPADQPLRLSASSLSNFYNNQYLYFVRSILRLRELDTIHPDARKHGEFLHKIFELTMKTADQSSTTFDERLRVAIEQTRQQSEFQDLYSSSAEAAYTQEKLVQIVQATSWVLAHEEGAQETKVERNFDVTLPHSTIKVRGKIDRETTRSDGRLSIVDYKSSDTKFDLKSFYYGLNSQLPTYIEALQLEQPEAHFFGATYLHMQDPIVKLDDIARLEDVVEKLDAQLTYRGLLVGDKGTELSNLYMKNDLVTESELERIIEHNQHLYQQAADVIRAGHFAINPYTEDGKSVKGNQLKNLTGFEADIHMGQARRLGGFSKNDFFAGNEEGGEK